MTRLRYIEGIGDVYQAKLNDVGVKSLEKLLETCTSKRGRMELAEKTGIPEKLILTWANHVDLFRIKGIGSQYADLLEEAGVDTVPELAQRNAENLYKAMVDKNEGKNLVRKLPSQSQVADWIEQASKLPRTLQY